MKPSARAKIEELTTQGIKVYFASKRVNCGNARCKSCPHGPYWYAYWFEPSYEVKGRQKVRCFYIGKRIDPEYILPMMLPTDSLGQQIKQSASA